MPKQSSTALLNLELGYLEESGSSIQVDTPEFQNWLHNNDSFRVEAAGENSYRARKESYTGTDYWYGVKKVSGKLHKRFIGKTNEVTCDRLTQIAHSIRQPSAKATASATNQVQPLPLEPQKIETSFLEAKIDALQRQVDTLQQQLTMLVESQGKIAA